MPRVYPRPHGEAAGLCRGGRVHRGLSPPTRGSRHGHQHRGRGRRSIPAHTGKPARCTGHSRKARVYPRPHGEAALDGRSSQRLLGLSPPTRGSPLATPTAELLVRSIPAHTGKPWRGSAREASPAVYPRPHGEAPSPVRLDLPFDGLSPPTRGSPKPRRPPPRVHGSIPAHTGKPG